jgi:hypothetical protein
MCISKLLLEPPYGTLHDTMAIFKKSDTQFKVNVKTRANKHFFYGQSGNFIKHEELQDGHFLAPEEQLQGKQTYLIMKIFFFMLDFFGHKYSRERLPTVPNFLSIKWICTMVRVQIQRCS